MGGAEHRTCGAASCIEMGLDFRQGELACWCLVGDTQKESRSPEESANVRDLSVGRLTPCGKHSTQYPGRQSSPRTVAQSCRLGDCVAVFAARHWHSVYTTRVSLQIKRSPICILNSTSEELLSRTSGARTFTGECDPFAPCRRSKWQPFRGRR